MKASAMTDPLPDPEWKTPINAEARNGFCVWVEFNDGVSGEVDLSNYAKQSAFAGWRTRTCFERLSVNEYGYLDWSKASGDPDAMIEPDEVYYLLTGLSFEEVYPELAADEARRSCEPNATDVVEVEPREGYSVWAKFADGTSGVADLSFLVDSPAFAGWKDREYFESVHVTEHGDVEWGEDLQRCGYSLYIDLTGLSPEEVLDIEARPLHV